MTVAAVEELREEFGEDFCGVVVCAGGLKDQWRDQILAFTCTECCGRDLTDPNHPDHDLAHVHVGTSSVLVIGGDPEKRWKLYDRVEIEKPQYVIVGYDQVIDDNNRVRELPQMFVVADEVTTIKSPGALITEAFRDTFAEAPFRYGLTGTPMENGRPEELFQLMVWVDDSVLGRSDLFDKTYVRRNKWGGVREYINLPQFHETMKQCSVSIDPDDDDVAPYMPTMAEPLRVLVQLDEESARVYELMADDLLKELAAAKRLQRGGFDLFKHYSGDSEAGQTQGRIMSKISCIKMLCSHPDQLIESALLYGSQIELRKQMNRAAIAHTLKYGAHDADKCPAPVPAHKHTNAASHKCPKPVHPAGWSQISKKIKVNGKPSTVLVDKPFVGSAYAWQLYQEGELDALDESPKVDEVCRDIDAVLKGLCDCEACHDRSIEEAAELNKIVVFSYHKLTLRILEQRYGPAVSSRYDGDMNLKLRDIAKKRFQQDPACRIFLTSDAGGYGVDLPQGNHLFNLDKPFTAGRVTQRNARVRRANLDFHDAVHARDYLIDGSLEVYYAEVTAAKQAVAHAVRTGTGHNKGTIKMNAASLERFLVEHDV